MGQWLETLTQWLAANPQWLGLALVIVACMECLAVVGLIFAAGIFLTVILWFSDGTTLAARVADAATTAIPWLIAPVVMWLSKAIPFFHRHETTRWILVGTPALLVAMIVLALLGGNPSQ